MPRVAPQDRLQPSLLDRLTDEDPQQEQEGREDRVLTMQQLRQCVLRDLTWLLNTGSLEPLVDLESYPLVAESTLNYGVPHLAGTQTSQIDARKMEIRLRQAIWRFEPRILRDSVKVKLDIDEKSMSHNAVIFYIEGLLWADPVPWHLFLKTEVDLEIGAFSLTEEADREGP
jgi:type VI secretion system protein ImpF